MIRALFLAALLTVGGWSAPALAQVKFTPPLATPPPTTPPRPTPPSTRRPGTPAPVIVPGIGITVTPTPPGGASAPVVEPAAPQPQVTTAPPVYRDVPWPKPRPVYVDGVLPPEKRPLMSLGRPALLDAEHRPHDIVLLANAADTEALIGEFGLELVSQWHIALLDAEVLRLRVAPGDEVDETVAQLLADKRVIGAQPNYLFELQQDDTAETSSDPMLAGLQYAPRHMLVDRAHAYSQGENTIVAVIDTGVDLSHNEFARAALSSFDAVERPGAEAEPHGTAIAGLIAAGHSMTGIAPKAEIRAARAFAEEEGRFLSDSYTIARAIDWAVAEGAQIVNMSFAGPADPLILKLMDKLAERDVLVVAAAGNNGPEAPAAYPAAHPHAIAVTATDADDGLYANANRGIYITVAAPGVDVIAPAPGNGYELSSGTSIATAHVTGIMALLLSRHGDLIRADIARLIGETAKDAGAPGPDPEFGLGLVDAYKAALALEEGMALGG